MKKAILFFAAFLMGLAMMAQTGISSNGFATKADGAIAATTSYTYKVNDIATPYYIGYQVAVDSTAGTAAGLGAVFTLYGSFDGVDYSPAIHTMTYYGIVGSSSDTVVVSSNTTASYYRFLKATWTVSDTISVGHTIKLQRMSR